MHDDYLTWTEKQIERLNQQIVELQGKRDGFKTKLEEYEAYRKQSSNLFESAKKAPTALLKDMFDEHPDKEFTIGDIKQYVDERKQLGMVDSKPNRSTQDIVYPALNGLVKNGHVMKLPPSEGSKSNSYRKANKTQ